MRVLIAKTGMETILRGSSRSNALTMRSDGVNGKRENSFGVLNCRRRSSLELTGKLDLSRTPLNLSWRGSATVEATAAVLSSAIFAEKSLELDLRADWILETVLVRQAFANEGSCCLVNSMEFIVVASGLEASCSGTMIGLE